MELKAINHGYGQNTYHLVFVPKYRWPVFNNEAVKLECKKAFYSTAYRYGFNIHCLKIMYDHIHLFVEFNPSHSISKVIQLFKGYSAFKILKKFSWVRKWYKRGHFWSAGKFYRSVGNVTIDTIEHYIKQSQGSWDFSMPEHQVKLNA